MSIPVFGLQAIKDKATRDAIQNIALRAGQGGSSSVEVQEADPDVNTPGTEGDIIYATGTDSIWVFVETSWERAQGGNGIYIQVRSTVSQNDTDYSTWVEAPTVFRNDSGTIALVSTVIENGEAHTDSEHTLYTYQWSKNGTNLTSTSATQITNVTGPQERALLITASDVANGGADAFVCTVNY